MSTRDTTINSTEEIWPALPYEEWHETLATLHMWTQVVGKVRMTLTPPINHWWHVTLYVTSRGLTTSPIPYADGTFEVTFDLVEHNLYVLTTTGARKVMPLFSRTVADFYREFMAMLNSLGINVTINTLPSEVSNPIHCDVDEVHASYDPVYANRFWRVLVQTTKVLMQVRTGFIGKSSPIHFFWGSFDLALTFFSGRRAPERKETDHLTREAYSHEVISFGFWPGNDQSPAPAFYAYSAPVPAEMGQAIVQPSKAFYSSEMGEFFLKYDDIRTSPTPDQDLLTFYKSAYEAAATLGQWDRAALERPRP